MKLVLIYKLYIIPKVFIGGYASFQKPCFTYKLLDKQSSQMLVLEFVHPCKGSMESIKENTSYLHCKIN